MPYKDPDKQREAQARWYAAKLARSWAFQAEEAQRKAAWLQTDAGKQSNLEATRRYRKKK